MTDEIRIELLEMEVALYRNAVTELSGLLESMSNQTEWLADSIGHLCSLIEALDHDGYLRDKEVVLTARRLILSVRQGLPEVAGAVRAARHLGASR